MRKVGSLILVIAFLAAVSHDAYSQINRKAIKKNNRNISQWRGGKKSFKRNVYNAVGISLNAFNYYGDLSPSPSKLSTDFGFTRPAVGFSFTHRFGPRYQLIAALNVGGIKGSDKESADPNDNDAAYRYVRNLSFRNRIQELSVIGQIDLFENQSSYISRVRWTPYVWAGLAVFHHNPQAQAPATDLMGTTLPNAGEWVNLRDLQTEGEKYSPIQLAIPFGIGARFRVNELIDVAVEYGIRYTFTDYLDDVSGNYVDLMTLDGELARAMSYRSNEVSLGTSTKVDDILNKPRYTGYPGFTTVAGFGHVNSSSDEANRYNARGTDAKDLYTVTTVRLTYIIGRTFHRAKFR